MSCHYREFGHQHHSCHIFTNMVSGVSQVNEVLICGVVLTRGTVMTKAYEQLSNDIKCLYITFSALGT